MPRACVLLVGPPGSGKSSVGKALSEALGWSFLDLDAQIEEDCKCSVQEVFAKLGEAEFRKMETGALKRLLGGKAAKLVIATGGGIMTTTGNFELMEELGTVVCLQASLEQIVERLKTDSSRPLLQNKDTRISPEEALRSRLSSLLAARAEYYNRPGNKIQTDGRTPTEIAEEIKKLLFLS